MKTKAAPVRLQLKNKISIKVVCEGAAVADINDLVPLQGGLKTLDNEGFQKLKRSLLQQGFFWPFGVWKHDDKLFIMDGHQRDLALKRMRVMGYDVPPLPIVFISATTKKEAKEKLLLLSSQYGKMSRDSLVSYINESELDVYDLIETVDLPTINLEKMTGELEKSFQDAGELMAPIVFQYQVVVDCKDEQEQAALIDKLKKQKFTCRAQTV